MILIENLFLVKNWHRQLMLSGDCFKTHLKQQDEKTIYLQTALLKFIYDKNTTMHELKEKTSGLACQAR